MKKYLITILIALGIVTYVYADISSSLVLYMPLDGRDVVGTKVLDISSTKAQGTLTGGPISIIGKKKQGIFFDGNNDYAPISSESTYDFERTSPFSISMWLKAIPSDTTIQIPISKSADDGTYSGFHFITNYNCSANNASRIGIALASTYGSNYICVYTTNTTNINNGNWHHYVLTYSGSSNASGVKLYQDGIELALSTGANSLTSSMLNNYAVSLGGRSDGAVLWHELFYGTMDEIYIYSKTLSADEVKELYRRGFIR